MELTKKSEFHTGLPGLQFQGSLYRKIIGFATVFFQQQLQQQLFLYPTLVCMIQIIYLYYITKKKWKVHRLPIITNEG